MDPLVSSSEALVEESVEESAEESAEERVEGLVALLIVVCEARLGVVGYHEKTDRGIDLEGEENRRLADL